MKSLLGSSLHRACAGGSCAQGAPQQLIDRGSGGDRHDARRSVVAEAGRAVRRRYCPASDPPPWDRTSSAATLDRHRRGDLAARPALRHHRARPGAAAPHRLFCAAALWHLCGLARYPSERDRHQPRPLWILKPKPLARERRRRHRSRIACTARQRVRGAARNRRMAPVRDPKRGTSCPARSLCLLWSNGYRRRPARCEAAIVFHGEGLLTEEIARRIGASRNAGRR